MVYKINEKKEVRIPDQDIERLIKTMDIDKEEAIEIWLEDEGYLINEEQEALCELAKKNKITKVIEAKSTQVKKKTQKERTRKENPTKEMIIAKIAELLPEFATDVVIENKGKLITFKINSNEFKLDLVQKRQKKETKEVD